LATYRFYVRSAEASASSRTQQGQILVVGDNLFTGEADFRKHFGNPTSLESDLLRIAAAVFAADRAAPRGEREDISRTFELSVPVANVGRLLPLVGQVEDVLRLLSNDGWNIHLDHRSGDVESGFESPPATGKTLLFSGGLDSLAAGIEFGGDKVALALTSHTTRNTITAKAQVELATLLSTAGLNIVHRQFFVSSRDGGPTNLQHAEENSQRTRSFVFLVIGALVARRTGNRELLYLAENGQMAIHLPLTQARIGAFSTHTAHPDVLAAMEKFLSGALAVAITIKNPFAYRTKRDIVQVVFERLPKAIPLAHSCWKNARLPHGTTHCGECIPCHVRRIAVEHTTSDVTAYARNVWLENVGSLPPEDEGRRNLIDLIEFVHRFATQNADDLMCEFPELYSPNIDPTRAIEMYRRFADEATTVLTRYPNVAPFLQ
jgi:7-cyano-7-deazaguanine synthase in queuosine biosynthesis